MVFWAVALCALVIGQCLGPNAFCCHGPLHAGTLWRGVGSRGVWGSDVARRGVAWRGVAWLADCLWQCSGWLDAWRSGMFDGSFQYAFQGSGSQWRWLWVWLRSWLLQSAISCARVRPALSRVIPEFNIILRVNYVPPPLV